MPRMTGVGLRLQVFGAENAKGRIIQYRDTTKARIDAVLNEQLPQAVEQMRTAMFAAYPMGRKTARSLQGEVTQTPLGPGVKISIGNYRNVKYLTNLVPGADFREAPYPIYPVNAEKLVFFFPNRIINGVPNPGWAVLNTVMHPGFGRQGDVLSDSGSIALSRLGQAVEGEVRSAVAEVTAGGTVFSVSRRLRRG